MYQQPSELPDSLESGLLDAFRRQETIFADASEFLGRLQQQISSPTSLTSESMDDLQRWLQRIAEVQANAAVARERFEAGGGTLTPAGRQEIAERETQLRRFQKTVDEVLARLQGCRSDMVPHLDSEVRRRSMHSAYQASLRTG